MKELDTKPERFAKNMAGFHLRMAQGLTLWALEPDIGYTPTRAALGFVTNPTEAKLINDPEHRQRSAVAIADAVVRFKTAVGKK